MDATSQLINSRYFLKIVILLLLLIAISITCLMIGTYNISFKEMLSVFSFEKNNEALRTIILEIRLPRILLAIAIGGGLSVTGAVFQAILMNPLAEPYILGVSSGGTFGAVLSFLLGLSFFWTQFLAFAGALSVIFLVFFIGKRFGEIEPNVLLLSGVMVGAFFSALIMLMMILLDNTLRNAVFWALGNLSSAEKFTSYYLLPVSIFIAIILSINSQKFNVLSIGTENAKHLGINTELLKNLAYILSSFLVGAIVSVSGIIGFVGLLIPHVCRLIFGVDNRVVIPFSFFIGAMFLLLSDTLARTIIAPAELPVGVITALVGAPVFIYLLRKRFNIST
ncbi:MAG: iron ABC transporter permease [Ignavibacteria bacterium]|jgi:iron complex transport system permease protein